MSLATIPIFRVTERAGARITLQSDEGHIAHLFILEEDILRVMVLPGGTLYFPRTWAVAPGQEDVPLEGRDRFQLDGFAVPAFQFEEEPGTIRLVTNRIRLTIQLQGLYCHWEVLADGRFEFAAVDRSTQNYNFG